MVKPEKPLQIRLTEPVIFLRGPSTGLDFRGRPQTVRQDGQPAMLRGLLTLRLNKPTRIRSIGIKLEGKARTEWPEGIGLRRMDTFEEHVIMSESTTYFSGKADSASRSRSARRAASLGPGVSMSQWDVDEEDLDDDLDIHDVPDEGDNDWVGVSRRGRLPGDRPLRSASALPGTHDGSSWHRDGFSRRGSFSRDDETLRSGLSELEIQNRGPSPAYTPSVATAPSRRSYLRQGSSANPSREPILSPIASAANSRGGSDRDGSSEAEFRQASHSFARQSIDALAENGTWEPQPPAEEPMESFRPGVGNSASIRPILGPSQRQSSSGVRFEDHIRHEVGPTEVESPGEHPLSHETALDLGEPAPHRAASVRTIDSHVSESSNTLTVSSGEHHSGGENHPVTSVTQAISLPTTPLPASPVLSPTTIPPPREERTSFSSRSMSEAGPSQPSSLYPRPRVASATNSIHATPNTSGELSEVREGRTTRIGSASTIVTNHNGTNQNTITSIASSSNAGKAPVEPGDDGRGRKSSKFSLSAAFRSISKGKSKSRTRAGSGSAVSGSRTPSLAEHPLPSPNEYAESSIGPSRRPSGIPSHIRDEAGAGPDFVIPFGRGGAGRSPTRERGSSPGARGPSDRSESRGRGRNKGMKVLTDAFHLGGEHEEGEDVHNWKDFRKGTYNYPISFPTPLTAPPTVHAEFGSVVYRLRASVVRVGALTPNLLEDTEVIMVATPQEDDMEESDNVIVERQWEEQMRYQITLSGKAFPIGGTIPISIRLMPLMKCKVHRLSVALEEKVDYYAQERKVARHEIPKKYNMIFIKQPDRLERIQPLLPILSDDPNAARDSPLANLARQAALNDPNRLNIDGVENNSDDDSMYASLLDPLGPWHLEQIMSVPDSSAHIKFTTKHDKTNIQVGHTLKVTIRVERGDDVAVDNKGRRKQFDIIIETPIKILDSRVNPQWNSLPTYAFDMASSSVANGSRSLPITDQTQTQTQAQPQPQLGTQTQTQTQTQAQTRPHSTTTPTESGPSSQAPHEDTLLERNIVYDRLMSGQVTETGEVPPTYGEVMASKSRSRGRGEERSRGRAGI